MTKRNEPNAAQPETPTAPATTAAAPEAEQKPAPMPIAVYIGPSDAPVPGVPMRELFEDDYTPEDAAAIVADWPRHYQLADAAPAAARSALARIRREREKAAEAATQEKAAQPAE